MKTLILCDDQLDFVTGSMSVKKRGKECVERTKIYINRNKEDIDKVIFKVTINQQNCDLFKRNGGELPPHCVEWTPGCCIEPTILKLLVRLQIPYVVRQHWKQIDLNIPDGNQLVIAGMNGNTTVKNAIERYWNGYETFLLWPGTWFFQHDENLFKWMRDHTQGIFEIPKRDKKKDLFVQRFKGNK